MNFETNGISRIFFAVGTMICVSGCGDDVTPAPNPATPGTQEEWGRPAKPPLDGAMPDGPGAVYAISRVRLGANDINGMLNTQLWKTFGYNLDSTVTMRSSAGVLIGEETCKRPPGGAVNSILDGEFGRDNAFGLSVLPMINALNADAEKMTNAWIKAGNHTLLIELPGFGASATYASMPAMAFESGELVDAQGMRIAPNFDGSDEWPVLSVPEVKTTEAYVAAEDLGGTFVGQFAGSLMLPLNLLNAMTADSTTQIRIRDPLITMHFSADRSRVERGVIAGYIDTEDLVQQAARTVNAFDPMFCGTSTAQSIEAQVRNGADILLGGKVDASRPCDSISIGIEFEATRAVRGAYTDPPSPQKDPCSTP